MEGETHVSTTMMGSITTTPKCLRCKGLHKLWECPNKTSKQWIPKCILCGGPHSMMKCPNQKPRDPKCLLCKGLHRLTDCPQLYEEVEAYEMPTHEEVVGDDQAGGQGAHQSRANPEENMDLAQSNEVVVEEGNNQLDEWGSHQPEAMPMGASMGVECEEDDKVKVGGPRDEDIQLHKEMRVEEPMREATKANEECFQRWDRLGHNIRRVNKKGATLLRGARLWSNKFTKTYGARKAITSRAYCSCAVKGIKTWMLMRWRAKSRHNKTHRGAKCVGGRKPSMVHGRASIVGVVMACITRQRWRLTLSGRQGIGWGRMSRTVPSFPLGCTTWPQHIDEKCSKVLEEEVPHYWRGLERPRTSRTFMNILEGSRIV